MLPKAIMIPDRLCKLKPGLGEVIIDVLIVCQTIRNLARIIFHSTKQIVSNHANCINIDFKTITSSLIKDFWCMKLKAFELLIQALAFYR